MKIVLMTSDHPRHIMFIREIHKRHNIEAVFFESKPTFEEAKYKKEINFFSDPTYLLSDLEAFNVEKGEINSQSVIENLKSINPDCVLVFGSSILKKRLINSIDAKWINIHTGIVQAFRGVDSCFWAIHDKKPEAVGATIHSIDLGIDTGSILLQGRTEIEPGDDIDTLFFKTCKLGIDLLANNLEKLVSLKTNKNYLKSTGKLYMIKHMNEKAQSFVNSNIENIIEDYLKNKDSRDLNLKILETINENYN
mgnify:CR=1 FL=1